MTRRRPPAISLSLLLLAACGVKDGSTATSSTTGDGETGAGVTTTGLSMSSSPSTGDDPGTTTAVTTGDPGDPGDTNITASTGFATTTSAGSSSGGPVECQIEQPRPGSCDAGAPKQPPVRFAGPLAPQAGAHAPPGPKLVHGGDDESFATTTGEQTFIVLPDEPGANECDIFAQDCDVGEKCNAWAEDGGSSWNATKCVPIAADPDQIGEPCTVDGSSVSGLDSCAKGAMCWDVGDDGKGTCIEVCSCSAENPVCTTQNTTCTLSNEGVLALCLPVCDPLDVDACAGGDVCINGGSSEFFICALDASGDFGGAGDPCEFVNACDPGHACTANNMGQFPGCDINSTGCCTPFCDLAAPACPGSLTCTPWYEQGTAPKCFEDVGICI